MTAAVVSPPAASRPASILLVDDLPANLLALEGILAPLGLRLVRAASGQEALRRILDEDFAAILLDLRLGDMSGVEVLKLMRVRQRNQRTPVLLLTAVDGDDQQLLEAYAHGAVDYLRKPLVPQVLRAKVSVFVELYLARETVRRQEEAQRARERAALEGAHRETLQQLLMQAPAGIAITRGPEFVFEFVNPLYEQLVGRPVVTGRSLREVLPEVIDQPEVMAALQKVMREGTTFVGTEFPVALERGGKQEEACFNLIYQPMRDADGSVTGLITFAVEVTDWVRARRAAEGLTEHLRQQQAALTTSEERLRLALAATELGTWDYDLVSGQLRWDARCKALFGLPPEADVDFDVLLAGLHPEDRERTHQALLRSQDPRGDGALDVEYRTVGLSDGVERWCRAMGRVQFEGGRAVHFVGTLQDMTERKRSEAERSRLLAREQRQASRLREVARAAVAITGAGDLQVALRLITEQVRDILGAHQAVVSMTAGQDWAQAITAVSLSDKYAAWREYAEAPDGSGIYTQVCRDNRPIRMTQAELEAHPAWKGFGKHASRHPPMRGWLAVPLVGREGANLGLIQLSDKLEGEFTEEDEAIAIQFAQLASVAVENTRLYEAAQVQRANLYSVLMQLPASVSILRGPGLVHEMLNLAGQRLTEGRELLGRPLRQAVPELEGQGYIQILERVQATGEPFYGSEVPVRLRKDRDGSEHHGFFNVAYQPLRDAEGKVDGVVATSFEVTEQVSARREVESLAAEIRLLNTDLERRVRERTAQLEEANRELESFSYSVSHDLRAPLRHITGFAQLLERRVGATLDETSRGFLSTIASAARQGGTLVDDLLSFSRMGRAELRQSRVDLREVVDEVRRELEAEAPGRVVEWRIGALPGVRADPALLRQVMRNLLGNALKYTRPRERAVIEVGSRMVEGEVEVWVRDNGVGFEMQYVNKLFGVFQRLHTSEQFEGTGIGLANVRRIISRHGGRTWAEGTVGQGATLSFSLPLAPSSPNDNMEEGSSRA